ncbi:MAG: hypothetical protein WC989_05805 [Micavibrio sp.]
MSSLIEEFLEGSKRITARVYYFIPLPEGEESRQLPSPLIGEQPARIYHAGILQEFIYQQDDRADIDDGLKDVFARVMQISNGIVKIHNRMERMAVMQEEVQLEAQKKLAGGVAIDTASSVIVPQVFIPKPDEETNAGMDEINQTFKALVPFPRLRGFLQYWQDNINGPLHHMQFVTGSLAGGYGNHHAIN